MLDTQCYTFSQDSVNGLFPMHVTLNTEGKIESVGPTLQRIFQDTLHGKFFFDCFRIEKPRNITDISHLSNAIGKRLIIWSNIAGRVPIKFRCVATRSELPEEAILIDFALGSSLDSMVAELGLSADDFKPNDFSLDLLYTIETQRTLFEDSQKLAQKLQQSKQLAEIAARVDHLTGIANRRGLHKYMETLLEQDETAGDYAFLLLDLDKFKHINDNYGNAAGDYTLKHIASLLRTFAGKTAFAARIGGDEFVLILQGKFSETELNNQAQALLTAILGPIWFHGVIIQIEANIGALSFNTKDDAHSEQIFISANIALHEAKQSSQAITLLTQGMLKNHVKRADIVKEIAHGIEAGEFVPFFQPQINTRSMQIEGFEVLTRWQHPQRGLLPPSEFISLAHQAKLMGAMEHAVMKQAIHCFQSWREAGRTVEKLSLNLTAENLRSSSFIESVMYELQRAKLSPRAIVLELLESVVFEATDHILKARCEALSEAGFRLALDDFGTGHAAMSTLIDHPISTLKIDRSFISGIDKNTRLQRITKTILAMAQQLQLKVIAEGVETYEELDVLEGFGCHFVQGYYFSAPISATETSRWIRAWELSRARNIAISERKRA